MNGCAERTSPFSAVAQQLCAFGNFKSCNMEWLLKFPMLRRFYISSHKEDMELVTREDSTRELRLYEMSCPSLEVLNKLNLNKVVVHRKHGESLDVLGEVASLQEIELVEIEDIRSFDFMTSLPKLRKIVLRNLPEATCLPHFPRGKEPLEIEVYNCRKLSDISAVDEMTCLKKLRLYSVGVSGEEAKEAVKGRRVALEYYN